MIEFEFSEAEDKKITYYSMVMCSIYGAITKYAPELTESGAVSLSAHIFNAVINATESNSVADAKVFKPENPKIARMRSFINIVFDVMFEIMGYEVAETGAPEVIEKGVKSTTR